jgi:hypothetical protein
MKLFFGVLLMRDDRVLMNNTAFGSFHPSLKDGPYQIIRIIVNEFLTIGFCLADNAKLNLPC